MAWVGPMIKFQLWTLLRALFCMFRSVSWLCRGVYAERRRAKQPGAWENSVQRLSILSRHKLDLVLQPSGPENFLLTHDTWVDPDYVLSDSVSLYYITKDEAVFVETAPDVIVSSSNSAPFLRQAQFENARKVLIMPMGVFHKLGEKIGDPKGQIVFITNTARCGSTLLTQIFEETKRSVAFSEPDCMNALSVVEKAVPREEYDRIIRSSVRVLCKPLGSVPDCLCWVIKLTSPTILYTPYLMRKFPGSKAVFMYRNGLPMCKSLDRAGHEMPLLDMLLYMGRNSVSMTQKIVTQMGLPPKNFATTVESRLAFASIVWASAIDLYREQRAKGLDVAGVRYEDIVADPPYAITQIFEFCGMPSELIAVAVEKGMTKDSQRASPLSRDRLARYTPENYNDEVKALCDKTCAKYNLPNLDEECVLEGTITNREKA